MLDTEPNVGHMYDLMSDAEIWIFTSFRPPPLCDLARWGGGGWFFISLVFERYDLESESLFHNYLKPRKTKLGHTTLLMTTLKMSITPDPGIT